RVDQGPQREDRERLPAELHAALRPARCRIRLAGPLHRIPCDTRVNSRPMKSIFLKVGVLGALAIQPLHAAKFADCYKVEDIDLPAGVPPEVGAIDFAED